MFKINRKKVGILNSEEGFTLVEVIAVLIILGILAAVAVPKFYDMQTLARERAVDGALAELNGQISLAFAKNVLAGGPVGEYTGFSISHWTDYSFATLPDNSYLITNATTSGVSNSIWMAGYSSLTFGIDWIPGSSGSPGRFKR